MLVRILEAEREVELSRADLAAAAQRSRESVNPNLVIPMPVRPGLRPRREKK
jgi:hypothetical protein